MGSSSNTLTFFVLTVLLTHLESKEMQILIKPFQFHIDGFTTPYRLDRNQNDGGFMLYIREDIPSNSLTEIKLDNEIKNIFIEINLR